MSANKEAVKRKAANRDLQKEFRGSKKSESSRSSFKSFSNKFTDLLSSTRQKASRKRKRFDGKQFVKRTGRRAERTIRRTHDVADAFRETERRFGREFLQGAKQLDAARSLSERNIGKFDGFGLSAEDSLKEDIETSNDVVSPIGNSDSVSFDLEVNKGDSIL